MEDLSACNLKTASLWRTISLQHKRIIAHVPGVDWDIDISKKWKNYVWNKKSISVFEVYKFDYISMETICGMATQNVQMFRRFLRT